MNEMSHEAVQAIISKFNIYGTMIDIEPYGSGHINRTYCSIFSQAGTRVRYIHQRINRNVFHHPELLMDNVARVIEHCNKKIHAQGLPEADRRCLTLVPTHDGKFWAQDDEGEYWRTYFFVERTRSCDVLESDDQAENVARAVGRFQNMVSDLPGPRLHDTIVNFHNAVTRYQTFHEVLKSDPYGRAADIQAEIDWFLANEERNCRIAKAMQAGQIPERITHNDTKVNNILLDDVTGEGICIIDLDTIMPGSLLYDFGDMVRTSTGTAAEDEPEASKMTMQMGRYAALCKGFISETFKIITDRERELFPEAGRTLTSIIGLRFITDYLQGDTYFRIHRPNHNLDRLRTQVALVNSIDSQWDKVRSTCDLAFETAINDPCLDR